MNIVNSSAPNYVANDVTWTCMKQQLVWFNFMQLWGVPRFFC